MSAEHELRDLLRAHGAVLIRERKHKIYRLADGRIFTTSKSPSDSHAARNALAVLRRMVGE